MTRLILEALSRRLCLGGVYNRAPVQLAPHILYTRNGDLHLDAVTLERAGGSPRETRLATYRLTGLTHIHLLDRGFELFEQFDSDAEAYEGATLFAVER